MHGSLDTRTMMPKPYYAYFPALIAQSRISEKAHILHSSGTTTIPAGNPPTFAPLALRANYPPTNPVPLSSFGPTVTRPLGDIALARSGDKGANVNLGIFVQQPGEQWDWLRSYLTHEKMQELMGDDWRDEYFIERVEFPGICAVHFVVYGALERGASSSPLLDVLGKGFADFIRARHVEIPTKFLEGKNIPSGEAASQSKL